MDAAKEKICFIIMPISDYVGYDEGHFGRVYEHLIKPAVVKAGFTPLRADEVKRTNYIAIDILKRIVSAEMCLCDISSKNPNVLYELGIRQAFDLPVTFIKDSITDRVFDIQGFRDIEYDEKMRVDNVQQNIEAIAETIINTFEMKEDDEVNSLISLLGIEPAKVVKKEISKETELLLSRIDNLSNQMWEVKTHLNATLHKPSLSVGFEPVMLGEQESKELLSIDEITKGRMVHHLKFGIGSVTDLDLKNKLVPIATIDFGNAYGIRKIMLNYAKLYQVKSQKRNA